MSLSDVLPYVPIIILIVSIIGLVINHLHRKSDKIRRVILELIKIFINPTIDKLKIESKPCEFEFPEILDYPFGISEDNGFKRFSKTKRIMAWRIRIYNKFCRQITRKILELTKKTKELGIIEYVTDSKGYHPTLSREYEDLNKGEIEDLLEEHELDNYKQEINELLKELPNKSKILCEKLQKLKDKWIRRYYLLQSDF